MAHIPIPNMALGRRRLLRPRKLRGSGAAPGARADRRPPFARWGGSVGDNRGRIRHWLGPWWDGLTPRTAGAASAHGSAIAGAPRTSDGSAGPAGIDAHD